MSFLPMTEYESSSEEVKREYEDQIARHGRITNMKRTLLHNVPAFKAYMEWYTLYDQLVPVIGSRAMRCFPTHALYPRQVPDMFDLFQKMLIDSATVGQSASIGYQKLSSISAALSAKNRTTYPTRYTIQAFRAFFQLKR